MTTPDKIFGDYIAVPRPKALNPMDPRTHAINGRELQKCVLLGLDDQKPLGHAEWLPFLPANYRTATYHVRELLILAASRIGASFNI